VPGRGGLPILDEVGDDQCAKSWGQGDAGIIRITPDFANAPLLIRFSSIGSHRG
jgi:hypothetical protein